jgi:hypothetical protein
MPVIIGAPLLLFSQRIGQVLDEMPASWLVALQRLKSKNVAMRPAVALAIGSALPRLRFAARVRKGPPYFFAMAIEMKVFSELWLPQLALAVFRSAKGHRLDEK